MTGIDPENILIAAGCNYRAQLTLLAGGDSQQPASFIASRCLSA